MKIILCCMWTMFIWHTVGITCEPLLFRTISGAVDQNVHNQLWSVVNVTCPAGQRLNSSAASIVTTCNSRGAWNPPVPDCIGIYTCALHTFPGQVILRIFDVHNVCK